MRASRSNSISSLSSSSSQDEEQRQIFVKNIAGNSKSSSGPATHHPLTITAVIPLTVPTSTTISTLTSLLALRTNLPPSDLRLVFAGKHLDSSSTLASIAPESTLHLALPLRGGMAKKPTCDYKKDVVDQKCKEKINPIIGECGFCVGKYCSKHRMLESHNCTGLEDCKKESHARNAEKLNSERTMAIKGI